MVTPQAGSVADLMKEAEAAFDALDYAQAEDKLDDVLAQSPTHVPALNAMAQICWHRYHDPRSAQTFFDTAAALAPGNADLWLNRAQNLHFIGNHVGAVREVKAALQQNPELARGYALLEDYGEIAHGDEHYQRLMTMALDPRFPKKARATALFTLGHVHDKIKDYTAAFDFIHAANEVRNENFEPRSATLFNEYLTDAFETAQPLPTLPPLADAPKLVFVVGMPRSGSTLIEQILTTQDGVESIGEASFMPRIWQKVIEECFGGEISNETPLERLGEFLTVERLEQLRAAYVDDVAIACRQPGLTHVVDKQLSSAKIVPVLASLFPDATIIQTCRHPLDVGLSCYFQNFAEINFSNRLMTIGAAYRAWHRCYATWSRFAFPNVYNVVHERLVFDKDVELPRLLNACDLPFDDEALHPERSHNIVKTASTVQVREPISSRGIGRWRHYADHLGPLVLGLGGWEWIRANAPEQPVTH